MTGAGLWLAAALAVAARAEEPKPDPEPEPDDLSRLPADAAAPAQAAPSALRGKGYLEDALTGWAARDPLAVAVPVAQPHYQNRLSLDGNVIFQPGERVRIHFSDRLNGYLGEGLSFPSRANARNDLRELSVAVEPFPRLLIEAGRINARHGVTLGFNPTDFFKPRTQVDLASIDPSVLRENRLGVAMVQAQWIADGGSLSLAWAPALRTASPLQASAPASFDPLLGQTNAANRVLASLSFELWQLNPQALFFVDPDGVHAGVNLSRVVGASVVVYGEWAGTVGDDLAARAVAFGKSTGTLPAAAPQVPQASARHGLQSDVAAGLSWTSPFKLTANAEVHFHQAGLSPGDFDRWIATGAAGPPASSELWYVRRYAADQGEPFSRYQLFFRADWPDLFTNLELEAVVFAIPSDRSALAQLSVRWFISREWTVALHSTAAIGAAASVEGTLPFRGSEVLQAVRYF